MIGQVDLHISRKRDWWFQSQPRFKKKTATKMLKITLEVKPTIKAEYSHESLIVNLCKNQCRLYGETIQNIVFGTFGVYTVPWDPGSPCQMMIEVDNHLRNERYLGSITILRRWARIPGEYTCSFLQHLFLFWRLRGDPQTAFVEWLFFSRHPNSWKKGNNTTVSTNMTMKNQLFEHVSRIKKWWFSSLPC